MEDLQPETIVPTRRSWAVRPLSWAESLTDNRPGYISQQLPVSQRPRLEPRDPVVLKNTTLLELAQFFKDNPKPPKHPRLLLSSLEGHEQPSRPAKLVKRASRRKHKSSASFSSWDNISRDRKSQGYTSIRKLNTAHSKRGGQANHGGAASSSFRSTLPPNQLPKSNYQSKELHAYISRWKEQLDNRGTDSMIHLPQTNIDFVQPAQADAIENAVMATIPAPSDAQSSVNADRPPLSLASSQSTLRQVTGIGTSSESPADAQSRAPQKPLPPVPTGLQQTTLRKTGSLDEDSISHKKISNDRTKSMMSTMTSPGFRNVSTGGSCRKSFREESTRARKLKHLHGNSQSTVASGKGSETQQEPCSLADHPTDQSTSLPAPTDQRADKKIPAPIDTSRSVQGDHLSAVEKPQIEKVKPAISPVLKLVQSPTAKVVRNSPRTSERSAQTSHYSSTLEFPDRSTAHSSSTITGSDGQVGGFETIEGQLESPTLSALDVKKKQRNSKLNTRQLNERIEFLERENKLLEAALMAVLKTGGSFMQCPCGGSGFEHAAKLAGRQSQITDSIDQSLNFDRQQTAESALNSKSFAQKSSAFETPPTSASFEKHFRQSQEAERPRTGEQRWSYETEDSGDWNFSPKSGRDSIARSSLSSALALYTQTRARLPGEFSRSKAYST